MNRPLSSRREDEFDEWVERATEAADPFMAWLAVVLVMIVGYELAVELSPETRRVMAVATWSIWALFVLEFAAKLWLAPRKLTFVRRHWLQALMLAVPALRLLRFARLLRIGRAFPAGRIVSASYRSTGTAKRLARSRLAYLGGISVIGAIGVAQLAYLFERDHPEGAFDSLGDALLWSFSALLASQADPVPATVGGRIAMLAGFALGLVVVATLAGTLGAYFIEDRRERAADVEASRAE